MFELSLVTLFFLALCLIGEGTGRSWLRLTAKPLASLGFLAAAWTVRPWESPPGLALLSGLVFSAIGDVLLLKKGSRPHFLCGLGAFLLAHVAFSVSFLLTDSVDFELAIWLLLPLGLAAFGISRWLLPAVPKPLKLPVVLYIAVISAMVLLAWALPLRTGLVQAAATLFFLSDVSVAIDRFKHGGFFNRLWGLPAYYIAQLLFVAWWAAG